METLLTMMTLGGLIGLVMALTGAGGGVLSVPLLVFGAHLSVQQAAPVGLLAVFAAAALGALLGLRQGIVRYRAAGLMGLIGMAAAPPGLLLAQRLPDGPVLVAFAAVLLWVAVRSLGGSAGQVPAPGEVPCLISDRDRRLTWTLSCARVLAGTGLVAGFLSGLLGVGGGFVIVPALTRYSDIGTRGVHATSLAVIALVSMSGVLAAVWHGSLQMALAVPFASGAVLAMLLGRMLAGKLEARRLQQAFAWVCVAVAGLMLARAGGWSPS